MKALFLCILVMFLASCSPFGFNSMGYEVLHEDLDTAWQKVAAMEYQDDPEDYCKSPIEFFQDGGGDCEDFAIALIYLLGPSASFIGIESAIGKHAIVKYDSLYLEPSIYGVYYNPYKTSILVQYTYDYVIKIATLSGTKKL
jgi:hypothetical protein